jgi:hypothetical protein
LDSLGLCTADSPSKIRLLSVAPPTVARSWRSLSANPTIKFRNLAKNSAIFLAFHSYVLETKIDSLCVISVE